MKRNSINPILILIVVLLTTVVLFSPQSSPQKAEDKTLEDKVVSLQAENLDLKRRLAVLEQRVGGLEKYIQDRAKEESQRNRDMNKGGPMNDRY